MAEPADQDNTNKMAEPADQDEDGYIKITYPEIEPLLHNLLILPQFCEQGQKEGEDQPDQNWNSKQTGNPHVIANIEKKDQNKSEVEEEKKTKKVENVGAKEDIEIKGKEVKKYEDKEKSKENDKDSDHNEEKRKNKDEDHDQGKQKEKDKEKKKIKSKDCTDGKENGKSDEEEKDKVKDKEKKNNKNKDHKDDKKKEESEGKEKGKDTERDKEKKKDKENEKAKEKKNKDKEKKKDKESTDHNHATERKIECSDDREDKKNKDKDHDDENKKEKSEEKEKDKGKDRENDKDSDHNEEKRKNKDEDHDQGKQKEKDREKDKEKRKIKNKDCRDGKENGKSDEEEKDKVKDKEKKKNKNKDHKDDKKKEGSEGKEKGKYTEKDKEKKKDKENEKEKEKKNKDKETKKDKESTDHNHATERKTEFSDDREDKKNKDKDHDDENKKEKSEEKTPLIDAMASLRLVLIAAIVICFCQLPANASQSRPRALVTQITKDATTLRYIFQIRQRTPLRIERLVLDIEEDYMWVRCDKKSYKSSTYTTVPCGAQLCKSYQYSGCGTCYGTRGPGCNNNTCVVPGLGSDSFELAKDVVALRSSDGSNPGPFVRFPRVAFACGSKGDLTGLPSGVAGVAGMSSSELALPAQLSAAAGFGRKFAMCLPGGNAPGALFFGDGPLVFLPPPGRDLSLQLIHTPLIKNSVYTDDFYIGVQRIDVNGVPLAIDAAKLRIGTQGRGGTKLSTVVPYTQLATPIYNSIVAAFAKQKNLPRVASVAPFDACFNSSAVGSTRVGPAVPEIDLVLQNNSTIWRIFGANSMVSVTDKVLCLGFVDAGEDPVTTIVIGTYQMQDNLLQFDLANSTLGFSSSLLFGQTTCSNFNFTTSA